METNNPVAKPCFRERCFQFWDWFDENEHLLEDLCMNANKYTKEDVIAVVDEGLSLLGELFFNLGSDHEFTFTVSGHENLFYATPYVVATMPEKYRNKWNFFPYMQPADISSFEIEMDGKRLALSDIMVKAEYDDTNNIFDIEFYHDVLAQAEDNSAYNIFYTCIDLSLGEGMSRNYIGSVNRRTGQTPDMFKVGDLRQHIIDVLKENKKELNEKPEELYFVYGFEPQEGQELRFDVITGITACQRLLDDYYTKQYAIAQSFEQMGIRAAFLAVPYNEGETAREMVPLRYELEDSLSADVFGIKNTADTGDASFSEIGRIIGGAAGTGTLYIDILLFDEEAFLSKVHEWAKKSGRKIYYSQFRQDVELELL